MQGIPQEKLRLLFTHKIELKLPLLSKGNIEKTKSYASLSDKSRDQGIYFYKSAKSNNAYEEIINIIDDFVNITGKKSGQL